MNKLLYIILLIVISACSTIREKAGLMKEQPDEYQVVSNPPLSVPPDLVNVESPEDLQKDRQYNIENSHNLSKGENNFLQTLRKQ